MKRKYKGVALVGTVAATIAWLLLAYGIFTVQSSQFQMLVSSRDSVNAQKLAEIDASLLKLLDYDDVTNNSALGELNLHLNRSAMQTISADGNWEDEIVISEEKSGSGDSNYGNYRVATINIYKSGETEPRFSTQVPILKTGQTYSGKAIDEFIEELKAKDRELEAKDKELEEKDKQLEAKDKELAAKIEALRNELLSAVRSAICRCAEGVAGS